MLARSLDLTPCVFSCGKFKRKSKHYSREYIEDLKSRIRREVMRINMSVLRKVWDNVKLRLNVLENHGGGHIENLIQQ